MKLQCIDEASAAIVVTLEVQFQCLPIQPTLSREHDILLWSSDHYGNTQPSGQLTCPLIRALSSAEMSPPASRTAAIAASLSFFLLSLASISRLALVFELPLGATSFNSLLASLGVKFTNPI